MTRDPSLTAGRLAAVRTQLPDRGAAVLTDRFDVQWLTGLEASNAAVLVSAEQAWLLTDFRYRTAAQQLTGPGLELEIASNLLQHAAELAADAGAGQLVLERDRTTLADDDLLAKALAGRVERVAAPRLLEAARAIKTPEEIERIAAAQELADAAFREVVLDRGLVGRTEREVALDLEVAMRKAGAQGVSFAPIIAAGAHGALPHADPREQAIPAGELVVIDWGCRLDGYCSDCTRTVATGPVDGHRQEIHALVRAAQDAALRHTLAGVEGKAVDAEARELIAAAGHGDHFGHGLGHGVGLEVHESPTLSPRSVSTLAPGHIVTVEPGVYLPGQFGVRVEELVVVTGDGPRLLTGLPREPAVVA